VTCSTRSWRRRDRDPLQGALDPDGSPGENHPADPINCLGTGARVIQAHETEVQPVGFAEDAAGLSGSRTSAATASPRASRPRTISLPTRPVAPSTAVVTVAPFRERSTSSRACATAGWRGSGPVTPTQNSRCQGRYSASPCGAGGATDTTFPARRTWRLAELASPPSSTALFWHGHPDRLRLGRAALVVGAWFSRHPWVAGAGRTVLAARPQPQAPRPTNPAPGPSPLDNLIQNGPTSLTPPPAPDALSACQGVHRPRIQGQGRPPGQASQRGMTPAMPRHADSPS
jgi:hypothetical protein